MNKDDGKYRSLAKLFKIEEQFDNLSSDMVQRNEAKLEGILQTIRSHLRQMAILKMETFKAYKEAGFTEEQALRLVESDNLFKVNKGEQ